MHSFGLHSCNRLVVLLCTIAVLSFCGCGPKPQSPTLIPEGLTYSKAIRDFGKPTGQVAFGNGPICVWNARHKTTGEPGHLIVAFAKDGSVREAWFRPGPFDGDDVDATLHESFGR